MTSLPAPEQWVLHRMNEMELAEMIEKYIDYYTEDEQGDRRSVHLPTQFVRHYLQRHDNVLPTVVAISTLPLVLGTGRLLAPDGLDRLRGIIFHIPKALRAVIPRRKHCTKEAVRAALKFLLDDWLCDVLTDDIGKCIIIADALTIIERSLLPDRPAFFTSAGRRGCGKTTTLTMLIMAVTGLWPAAAAWSTNEEERRKALMSYFLLGVPYILWDNIARGTQISCPHIEKSCTSAFYSDRQLGVSKTICTSAATIHHFTGNNIGAKGDLASRSLHIRLDADRADPENREFKHPDPIAWTRDHRAEILAALYTILLGNPQLRTAQDAPAKTRFKMWWRMVGSAVEYASGLMMTPAADFQELFVQQDEDDEESVALADILAILAKEWPKGFDADDVAGFINREYPNENERQVREFLFPGVTDRKTTFSSRSIGQVLARYLDDPVEYGGRTFILRRDKQGKHAGRYRIEAS
jgi:hypothetical protein